MSKKYWLIGCDFYFENRGDLVVTLCNKYGSVLFEFKNIRKYNDFDEHIQLTARVMHDFVYGMPSRVRKELSDVY